MNRQYLFSKLSEEEKVEIYISAGTVKPSLLTKEKKKEVVYVPAIFRRYNLCLTI